MSEKDSVKLIKKALRSSVHMKEIVRNTRVLNAMISCMRPKEVSAKKTVMEANKQGREMFVCAQGELEAIHPRSGEKRTIRPGQIFGEMAFICNSNRKYTVTAKTPCLLWVLHQKDYAEILQKHVHFTDDDYVNYLKRIPIFQRLNRESLLTIRNMVRVECYAPQMRIITEGEEGNEFFVITGGSVLVCVTDTNGRDKIVGKLKFGDFFGEGALLGPCKRKATVIAEQPGVECMIFDRENFSHFFHNVELIRQAASDRNAENRDILNNDIEYKFINFEDLKLQGTISICNFGRIDHVLYKADPKLNFALKTLRKADISKYYRNVFKEKNILMNCRCRFIPRLYKTFKDEKYLYYLQELCLGGNLRHLIEETEFDEKTTKFVAACVLEAFDYLHSRFIVYNNLNTENLVFDSRGYIKLVGFFAASEIEKSNRADSETPVVGKDPRSYDYITLGCLIYEMLVGESPLSKFEQEKKDINEIVSNINFPTYIKNSKSIIKKMWKPNVCVSDIRNHKWYQDFSWPDLQSGVMTAPYVPKSLAPTYVRYDKEIPPDDFGSWDRDF